MNILLTGSNGYIGSRLLLLLLDAGHTVHALVRNKGSTYLPVQHENLKLVYADLLEAQSLQIIPENIDIAYYLVHAMSYGKQDFPELEKQTIENFIHALERTKVKQVIYLSGLSNDKNLSLHLASRYKTEIILKESGLPYTILRAGIIIGSGSASFEVIRDLVDKLPVMVAPKWINNLCQPIAIHDVLRYLVQVQNNNECINQVFDIGGPDQLSYKEMMLKSAEMRQLKRYIFTVPVLTPRLSSYWLYFVTSVNFYLASSIVDSVKNQAICKENRILSIFPDRCLTYEESLKKAFDKIEQNPLLPSWKDSLMSSTLESKMSILAEVPTFGCLRDEQIVETDLDIHELISRVWSIGGEKGWYYMGWAWTLRGFLDKIFGGIGLNRGRAHPTELQPGSTLDFWRVLIADKQRGRLLLFAEMKVPGEAWLEFEVTPTPEGSKLRQTATFRPKGLYGRFYWYSLFPIHKFLFKGMANAIATKVKKSETSS